MPILDLPDVNLFYAEDGSGPPIVWLQGLNADHAAWTAQIFAFQQGFRCLRPDNRGAGRTEDGGGPITTAACAADVVGLLDALGLERAHVVGLSLGGAIAQSLAIDFSDRVDRLVLVGTFARRDPWSDFLLGCWIDLRRLVGPTEFFRQALPWLVTEATLSNDQRTRAMLQYAERHQRPDEDFARQARAALTHDRLAALGRVTAPTLVLRGERDLLSPPERSREIAEGVPNSRLATIPGAGHLVNLEAQQAFNRAVREFLTDSSA